ncbi:MAG: hypothetical protein WC516_06980 [Patescibacteria group bacterium]|jgi:hypothetical protein
MIEVDLTEDDHMCLGFAYNAIYDKYVKAKRSRPKEPEDVSLNNLRIDTYGDQLRRLQVILKDKLKINCEFKDL